MGRACLRGGELCKACVLQLRRSEVGGQELTGLGLSLSLGCLGGLCLRKGRRKLGRLRKGRAERVGLVEG